MNIHLNNYAKLLKENFGLIICTIAALLAVAIAYQPVMFNFFTSDDFHFISQLHAAKQDPLLLFHNLDEGTPYCRPLLYVILFFEYSLCGANGCALRVISIAYELLAALVLGLLLADLIPKNLNNKLSISTKTWCFFSAGLFLLYPLHTEPINWFITTNDVLANLFFLSSFLFYIWWREKRKKRFELLSCLIAICAFLTKESTVVLPAILVIYELLEACSNLGAEHRSSNKDKPAFKVFDLVLPTTFHWLLLAGYLVIRKILTGYFVGNQSEIAFCFSNTRDMIQCWAQSLKMIFVPLSSAVFNHNLAAYTSWVLLILSLSVLTIYAIRKERKQVLLITFITMWFFIYLLPILRFFMITPDLLNARFGYLASVPLCAFLTYGLAFKSNTKLFGYLRYPLFLLILACSCFILHTNNLAWSETGKLTNNLLSEFRRIHKELGSEDFRIYFLNIPFSNKGVAVNGLKCIESMNHIPFSKTNFNNGVWLSNCEQALPIGIMQRDLEQQNIFARFYYWNKTDQHFHTVIFPREIQQVVNSGAAMSEGKINDKTEQLHIVSSLGAPNIVSSNKPTFVFLPKQLACWAADLIILKIHIKSPTKIASKTMAELNFTNDAQETIANTNHLLVPLDLAQKEQLLVFPVRGIPIWAFGGQCQTIQVSFPKDCAAKVDNAYAASLKNLMPELKILYAGYDKDTGRLELSRKYPQALIQYDASHIQNCSGVSLEVIGPGESFKELNSPRSYEHTLIQLVSMNPSGEIKPDYSMFSTSGLYKVRLRPIDAQGNQIGFCSDHFILLVLK